VKLRKRVELMWFPMTDERFVDLPDSADIVAVDFHTPAGLMQGRAPAGVWVEMVVQRYDDETGRVIG